MKLDLSEAGSLKRNLFITIIIISMGFGSIIPFYQNKTLAAYKARPKLPVSNFSVPNPPLSQPCNVALVIDSSGSTRGDIGTYQNAFITFVEALSGNNTQFSVTDFDTHGRILQPFTTKDDLVKEAILKVKGGGSTNWEDGLEKGRSTFPLSTERPNLVIFASDGGANASNGPGDPLSRAVDVANKLKSQSKARIIAIGIIDDGGPGINNLSAISGSNVDTGDITTSDVITTNFAGLAARLGELATGECSIPITEKDIPPDPTPTTKLSQTCHATFMGWWDWCAVLPVARYILSVLLAVFSSVAVLMLIYGGVLYITSSGDPQKTDRAKKVIMYTLLGVLVVAATWGLISLTASLIGAG